jgi:ubiquinone/menaquinone biosynthesis C-methylase UbiE
MQEFLRDRLACPACGAELDADLACSDCGAIYGVQDDVYDLVYEDDRPLGGFPVDELDDEPGEETVTQEEYDQYVNEETREAREKVGYAIREPLQRIEGAVLDLATGMAGGLFAPQLGRPEVTPIASDESVDVLQGLREQMPEVEEPHAYVACNPRALPFRDDSLDAVTSAGGLNNVVGTETILDEVYRVIEETGEYLGIHVFVEEDSESAERALEYGLETAYVEERFRQAAVDAGFETVEVWLVDSAEAAENPYDRMPVTGDEQTYAVVRLDPRSGTESSLQNQLGQEEFMGQPVGRMGPM